jgi:hypothetical protein
LVFWNYSVSLGPSRETRTAYCPAALDGVCVDLAGQTHAAKHAPVNDGSAEFAMLVPRRLDLPRLGQRTGNRIDHGPHALGFRLEQLGLSFEFVTSATVVQVRK